MQLILTILLWTMPGFAWSTMLGRLKIDRLERFLLGQAAGIVTILLLALLTAYLPGRFFTLLFIFLLLAVIAALFWFGNFNNLVDLFSPEGIKNAASRHGLFYLVVLLVAVGLAFALRFWNLGYAQFQGDEGAAITRAARVMIGGEQDIFLHKKGPGELLVVMATWSVTGYMTEWLARLPFAWANFLGVITLFKIGQRLKLGWAALFVLLFAMLEGYLIGFGRIVQYQSLVFFLVAAGYLALCRQRDGAGRLLLFLAAALFAAGALAHYDAVLIFPAILLLIGHSLFRLRQQRDALRREGLDLLGAGGIALAILAIFYLPFFSNPEAGQTSEYLLSRLGTGESLFHHLPDTFNRTLIYDSPYLLLAIGIGVALWFIWTWGQRWLVLGIVASGLLIWFGQTYFVESDTIWGRWAPAPLALLIFGTLALPSLSVDEKSIFLWFAFPAFFYLYLVALPLTHIYSAIPALFLLFGLGLFHVWDWLHEPEGRLSTFFVSGLGVLMLFGWVGAFIYSWTLFVNNRPEYLRNYENMPTIFAHPKFEVPEEGLFGFPYQAGWQAVNHLFATGQLQGSYDTNEEIDITNYYMHSAVRLTCATPDYYVVAENVQDEVDLRFDQIEREYEPIHILTVGDEPKITIYGRAEVHAGTDRPLESAAETAFSEAQRLMVPAYVARLSGVQVDADGLPAYEPLDVEIGGFGQLIGYQVDMAQATPGGYIDLILFWEAVGPSPINYQTFTHLHDGELMRGQLDGRPQCGNAPTALWQAGQYIIDPYRIPINGDSPTGEVPLTVGMYDLATLERVPVVQDGVADNKITVTTVEIR